MRLLFAEICPVPPICVVDPIASMKLLFARSHPAPHIGLVDPIHFEKGGMHP